MARAPFRAVVRSLRGSAATAPAAEPTDQQLLSRFARGRDEAAFASLVGRHGPLVMGVCRRVLRNAADAEDAFQATFLVLARRAGLVAWRSSVGNWLHGTALRLARKLLVTNSRRRAREQRVQPKTEADATATAEWKELCTLLDGELRRLPTSERAALLACYFEGRTQDQAARELGWSLRTFQRRLERGRDLLRARLLRKGLPLPVAFLAGVLLNEGAAAATAGETARAAVVFVTGGTSTARAAATSLAVSSLRAQARGVLRLTAAALVLAGLCGAAVHFDFLSTVDEEVPLPPAASGVSVVRPLVDAAGDPLPEGAVDRLGSARLRHADAIVRAAFSPDGHTLLAGDRGGNVVAWDLASGWRLGEIREIPPLAKVGPALTLVRDGRVRVTVESHRLAFVDATTGKRLYAGEPDYPADSLAVSPDGKTVATWSEQEPHILDVWDATTGKHRDDPGHRNPVTSLSFSGDGGLLLSADGGREGVRLWEPLTGRALGTVGPTNCREVVFAPDGKSFVGFVADTNFSGFWEVRSGQQLDRLTGYSCSSRNMVFDAEGKLVLEGVWGRKVARLWDVQSGEATWEIAVGQDRPARVTLSPGGAVVASGGYNGGVVRRWSTRSGFEMTRLTTPHEVARTVAIAPGAKTIATSGGDGPVYLWDMASRRQLRRLEGLGEGYVLPLAFTADGRLLLGVGGGRARVWDVATGNEVERFAGHDAPITAAAIAPDGRFAAAGYSDTTILIWDLTDGKSAETEVSPEAMDRLWAELADADDHVGYRAAGTLAAVPRGAVPFLAERISAADSPNRTRRALRVLERIHTPEALKLLRKLAAGPADADLTRESRAIAARASKVP
jgi:RNA polymerase sigma factor (sigma-70 family)